LILIKNRQKMSFFDEFPDLILLLLTSVFFQNSK